MLISADGEIPDDFEGRMTSMAIYRGRNYVRRVRAHVHAVDVDMHWINVTQYV
jgi:hypothetical protein